MLKKYCSKLKLNKIFVLVVLMLMFNWLFYSQEVLYSNKNYGFNVSANIAIGSHFQRCGFNLNFYYVKDFFQSNSELRAYFSIKNLGPKFVNTELVLAQGIVLGYGQKQSLFNPFIHSVSNQTAYKNSFSYSYNAYFNHIKTTQQTGIVSLQFDKITVITENDILARPTLDRFRTGAFLIQYQYDDKFQVALNNTMWTGQMGKIQTTESTVIYSQCYMDTTAGKYCNFSNGLMSAQFKYNVGLSQNAQLNIGVDSEHIRNVVQNKFIHDARFIPKKLKRRKVCHIPMLDTEGNAYLYKTNQRVKKSKLYWNLFSNPNLFY